MEDLTTLLTADDIATLQAKYSAPAVNQLLASSMPRDYPLSEAYVDAIIDIFYSARVPDEQTERDALSVADRERCIISILASQHERYTLAVHIYLALMEKIRPAEIANILLLAGVYSGVNSFADGVIVAREAMTTLRDFARSSQTDPVTVLTGLRTKFAGTNAS